MTATRDTRMNCATLNLITERIWAVLLKPEHLHMLLCITLS